MRYCLVIREKTWEIFSKTQTNTKLVSKNKILKQLNIHKNKNKCCSFLIFTLMLLFHGGKIYLIIMRTG